MKTIVQEVEEVPEIEYMAPSNTLEDFDGSSFLLEAHDLPSANFDMKSLCSTKILYPHTTIFPNSMLDPNNITLPVPILKDHGKGSPQLDLDSGLGNFDDEFGDDEIILL
ncbi:hypothetical protein HDU67_005283, partial [Dinochytrium kinnereticum]